MIFVCRVETMIEWAGVFFCEVKGRGRAYVLPRTEPELSAWMIS
jgi:hypothetical protein